MSGAEHASTEQVATELLASRIGGKIIEIGGRIWDANSVAPLGCSCCRS